MKGEIYNWVKVFEKLGFNFTDYSPHSTINWFKFEYKAGIVITIYFRPDTGEVTGLVTGYKSWNQKIYLNSILLEFGLPNPNESSNIPCPNSFSPNPMVLNSNDHVIKKIKQKFLEKNKEIFRDIKIGKLIDELESK